MSFAKAPNFLGNLFTLEMKGCQQGLFRFDSFLLNAAERELRQGDDAIPLSPKTFDVLLYLVRNSGHLVTKDELMSAVWPDAFVEEGNVSRTIHILRKTLGDGEKGKHFIKTVPTKGYRFVADVESLSDLVSKGRQKSQADERDENTGREAELVIDMITSDVDRTRADVPRRARMVLWVAVLISLVALITGLTFETNKTGTSLNLSGLLRRTKNGKAYQYYQQGRFYLERHDDGDWNKALTNFDKAIELDPGYADAYAGRADARIRIFWVSAARNDGTATAIDEISQAGAAIDKALELDVSNSYAHTMVCRLKGTYYWQFESAEKECRQAIELDPKDHEARREFAMLLNSVGRTDEALSEIDNAITLAPTSYNKQLRGVILYFSRRYDEAIEQFKQVKETDPDFWFGVPFLMDAYEMKGDWRNALEYYVKQKTAHGATAEQIDAVRAAFVEGNWQAVSKIMADEPNDNMYQYAGTLVQAGEFDKAFEVLNTTADRRQVWIVHSQREPRFDPIRNDPRFVELLKRLGFR